jgi:hypothetical protein
MTTNSCRPLFATLTGIALAAVASSGSAAPQHDVDAAPPSPQVIALQSPRTEAAAPRATSPLTLHLEDASGNAVRLVHVPGIGWEYDQAARGERSPLKKAALQTTVSPSARTGGDDVPLTVFIDGPSGFTYVWNRDDGWKYVGKLVDDTL